MDKDKLLIALNATICVLLVLSIGMVLFTCLFGIKHKVADFNIDLEAGEIFSNAKASAKVNQDYVTAHFERLFINVDPPHPALRIIHAPYGAELKRKTTTMNVSGLQAKPQSCVQVNNLSYHGSCYDWMTVWTTTEVPDVAVLMVEPSHYKEISMKAYNGSNYLWFKSRAYEAVKGANKKLTRYYLPYTFRIFLCNPLNQSTLFDVKIVASQQMYEVDDEGTEWVGQKSMSVAASDDNHEEIVAQFELDEPINKTIKAKVTVKGRPTGGLATIIVESVLVSLMVVLLLLATLIRYVPRCVARWRYPNNWQNIPDSERTKM